MKTDSILPETDFFFSENDTVLSKEERDSIEGYLTELECLNALKDMEPDKSPGTDGLPSEFYQFFWSDVSKPLLEAFNYGFEIGQLSISQKRGINNNYSPKWRWLVMDIYRSRVSCEVNSHQ